MAEPTNAEKQAFAQGRYEQCRRLLTSPRMNKAQREVIENEAEDIRADLEALGVKFEGRGVPQ